MIDARAVIAPDAKLAAVALEWDPIRAVRLMLTAQRDERSSNIAGRDYRANLYGVSAVLWF